MKISNNSRISAKQGMVWKGFAFSGALLLTLFTASITPAGSSNSYTRTDLVSDVPGRAKFTDPNLVNAWGSALGGVFWVADNGTGLSTLYALDGTPQSLVVTIPPSASNTEGVSTTVFGDFLFQERTCM